MDSYLTSFNWQETDEIGKLLNQLEALKIVIEKFPPRPERMEDIRRRSLLKSAVYSARVENVPAHIDDPLVHKKIEIRNLLSAYSFLTSASAPRILSETLIYHLHRLVLKDLSGTAGEYRAEPWAVFNQAGVAVHLAPVHFKLAGLMKDFIVYINQFSAPVPVKAAITQFIIEKIHPFADGNGRVGRLVSAYILTSGGYGLSGLVPIEEYTDNHRDAYYTALLPGNNCTEFISYFIQALVVQANSAVEEYSSLNSLPPLNSNLLPRRQEILNIITDHPLSSFNFICRRFPTIKPSTIHLDLQQLQKQGLIRKHGISRGVVYSPASS
jgi:Fic family protein